MKRAKYVLQQMFDTFLLSGHVKVTLYDLASEDCKACL